MADPITRFEIGDTRLWTVTYSATPGTVPRFAIFTGSGAATVAHSVSCTTTGTNPASTYWYAPFTIPNTPNTLYSYQFVASYAEGQVVNRGMFHAIKTTPIG